MFLQFFIYKQTYFSSDEKTNSSYKVVYLIFKLIVICPVNVVREKKNKQKNLPNIWEAVDVFSSNLHEMLFNFVSRKLMLLLVNIHNRHHYRIQ